MPDAVTLLKSTRNAHTQLARSRLSLKIEQDYGFYKSLLSPTRLYWSVLHHLGLDEAGRALGVPQKQNYPLNWYLIQNYPHKFSLVFVSPAIARYSEMQARPEHALF